MNTAISKLASALPAELHGVIWSPEGYASFSGEALSLYREIDATFLRWAKQRAAEEYEFSNFIAADDLAKVNYLESFGHLATMPTCVHPETGASECLNQQILTPAACYHFYSALQGKRLPSSIMLTTRANCFRREQEYHPLKRQWCFGMREIVCIGTSDSVRAFLDDFKAQLTAYFQHLNMQVRFEQATDPFFNPKSNPKYVMQRIDPVKHEMVFNNELAIGSINNHRTTFGEAFDIQINGEPAHSACVAFGIERWMYALTVRGRHHVQ